MISGTSSAGRFDIYETVNVLWFEYVEEVVCDRDNLILNTLFNFDQMKELEYWGGVKMFGSAGNGTSNTIFNMLKALNLSDG